MLAESSLPTLDHRRCCSYRLIWIKLREVAPAATATAEWLKEVKGLPDCEPCAEERRQESYGICAGDVEHATFVLL